MTRFLFPRQSVSSGSRNSHLTKQHRRRRLRFERLEARAMLSVNGDFNGDGFDDLAIGVPGEDVGGIVDAGAVNVIYGSRKGLAATGNQFWHQNVPGVDGVAAINDHFGSALAVGDFNGDGFDDLAIGVPFKTVSAQVNAGAVNVLYGSASGLRAGTVDQLWTQDSPGINDAAEAGDQFGSALAAGDFNGDGRDDLAIGVPFEDVGSVLSAGMVNVLYGSSSGLKGSGDQHWHQNSSGIGDTAEVGDNFGRALAAGNFNGDGRDDLAIGVPSEVVGNIGFAGAVNVIYGSASGLTNSGDQFWHQDSSGVADDAEAGDQFGSALAAGDFNGDGRDDLAISVPGEAIVPFGTAGRVNLLYGSTAKLKSSGGVKQLTADALGFASTSSAVFGIALAAGDFDGDGRDDLAIGASGETVSGQAAAGAVYVAYGSSSLGLATTGAQRWHQDSTPNMPDVPQAGDFFGGALVVGDYNGDGNADLAIGVRGEKFGPLSDVGAVQLLYGFFIGLTDAGNQFWHQGLLNSTDNNENSDGFGSALG